MNICNNLPQQNVDGFYIYDSFDLEALKNRRNLPIVIHLNYINIYSIPLIIYIFFVLILHSWECLVALKRSLNFQ